MNLYLKIFLAFLKIGTFSFGGGNAILPLIRNEVVTNYHWISGKEFTELIAISQAVPGPIAINGATYSGYRAGGFLGALVAIAGVVLPTFIIMIIFTKFFLKFKGNKYLSDAFIVLKPATVGLVAAAAVLVSNGVFMNSNYVIDYKSIIIAIGAFIALYKYKADPIVLTVIAGILGLILYR